MTSWRLIEGDCRDVLRTLPAQSVHTCVTSPPYFGLRDYGTGKWEGGDEDCDHKQTVARHDGGRAGVDGFNGSRRDDSDKGAINYRDVCGKCGATRTDSQIGLEPTPDEFVAALVAVFREVRRVLRDDGTVWLNLGDSYAGGNTASGEGEDRSTLNGKRGHADNVGMAQRRVVGRFQSAKPKDLLGIPWMVAFALRADGWYLRSDIVWSKPNPMPESVTDRPTKAHEYVFLLSKGPRYYWDADAIRESDAGIVRPNFDGQRGTLPGSNGRSEAGGDALDRAGTHPNGRNKRSVWTVATQPYPGAHFATFPPKLIEPCILAGCPEGGMVLDPFAGAGTTGVVALRHGREFIGIELNAEYAELARPRLERYWRDEPRPEEAPQTESLFDGVFGDAA